MERVGMLEAELFGQMPALIRQGETQPVTLHIAVNADSLGTWFLDAIAAYTHRRPHDQPCGR
jgi:LysR family transcriptional regulator (chromosome initiation inhibitor)